MIRLQPDARARMLALHGWTSIFAGLFIFVIAFTGTCAVFARDELSSWSLSAGEARPPHAETGYDRVIRDLAARFDRDVGMPAEILMFIAHGSSPVNQVSIVAPHHGEAAEATVVKHDGQAVYDVDPTDMSVKRVRYGDINALYQNDWTSTIGTFLVHLHTDLWLPAPWGRYITGLFGLALLVALVSGLLVYHRNIREALTLRLDRAPKVKLMDAHKLMGVWTFFFGIVIAFTGTLLSFAVSFLLPITAYMSFAGDLEKAEEAFLNIAPRAHVAAPTANIDTMVADARVRAGEGYKLDRIRVINLGDRNATIDVIGIEQGKAHITIYRYDGATGRMTSRIEGLAGDGRFNKILGIALSLHLADFGGPLVQFVWMLMGLCLSLVIVTGMMMWVERRVGSARGSMSQASYDRMGRISIGVCAGLPLAVTSAFYVERLIVPMVANPYGWMATIFLIVLGGALALTFLSAGAVQSATRLLTVTGIGMAGVPLMNALATGRSFVARFGEGEMMPALVDLLLLILGISLLWIAHRAGRYGFIQRAGGRAPAMAAAE